MRFKGKSGSERKEMGKDGIFGAAFERRKRTKSLGLPHREAGVFHSWMGWRQQGGCSEIRRAEEKISLISGSSLSVTSCLSNEANTNLIAHNNDRLPLRTSSLSEETKTNLIAHNNSGISFHLVVSTDTLRKPRLRIKLYKMLAFECLNFTLGGSLIRGLVRKLAIRHPQNQCKILTLGGSLIPSLCQTRPINSETEDFVRQAVDGLGERDSPSRLPLEPHQDLLDVIVCL